MFFQEYISGFHFFKTKTAAKRRSDALNKYCSRGSSLKGINYKVITCTVKKSWITEIGTESADPIGKISRDREEIIVVAKKAIFPNKEK